jgi:hypothetical protein
MPRRRSRAKRKRISIRSSRVKKRYHPILTPYRMKVWQAPRWVLQAKELGKQELIEKRLLEYLEEKVAAGEIKEEHIDYYLGAAKEAEKIAEKFPDQQQELLFYDLLKEAEFRGLNTEVYEYCLDLGKETFSWVQKASYYDWNGLMSREFPEVKGVFCSYYDSYPYVYPEHIPSYIYPGFYYVVEGARIFSDDLNILLEGLNFAVSITPAFAIYYYPYDYLMEVWQPTGESLRDIYMKPPEAPPEPWSVLLKKYDQGDDISVEDVNNMLEILEYLRLYWAPELEPFPTRLLPGDPLTSHIYNNAIMLLEKILLKIKVPPGKEFKPPPAPDYILNLEPDKYEAVKNEIITFNITFTFKDAPMKNKKVYLLPYPETDFSKAYGYCITDELGSCSIQLSFSEEGEYDIWAISEWLNIHSNIVIIRIVVKEPVYEEIFFEQWCYAETGYIIAFDEDWAYIEAEYDLIVEESWSS